MTLTRRIAPLLALALLVPATLAPPAAAQLPGNPFEDAACAAPGGSGVIGYARAMLWLACFAALFTGYTTYELVCDVSGGC